MSCQSPLISIPKKSTHEVDWNGPIRTIIGQLYGEDPKNYAEECSILQRCRQDAVKGASSDQTGRDLLYKYFGQLELLELRFAEIKVPFIWTDAFTLKETTQTSLAFEKASIIHLLAAVLSSLAASTSRADPEGVKRAYFNLRASAGMLTYINENFLHAPSTDLGREVVHLLIGLLMAQSTEVFTSKLIDEKKAPALVCRSANSAAGMYSALVDEMKEFQGKGIFDRNWLYVLQIKAKLFTSMAQYYRSVADAGGGKHGAALVRMKVAEAAAQEASKLAATFSYGFYATATPSLPADAGTALMEITKAHATVCAEAKEQAIRDNELIYHDILPSEASLQLVEKLPAASPITIQEVYANPDVSKLIGPDIFARLVPLAVHESASIYSEEKAKLIRSEVERVDMNEGEVRASLEHLGFPGILLLWQSLLDDEGPAEVDIKALPQVRGDTDALLRSLDTERQRCERELQGLSAMLESESRECERMRAKYAPDFVQSPSGQQNVHFRANIASNLGSISAASTSDGHLHQLWQEIRNDVPTLALGDTQLRSMAQQIAAGTQMSVSLLDLEEPNSLPSDEKEAIAQAIRDARERLDRLGKIRRERDEVLKDLKEKLQNDDVSNLLLLNRRSQHVEPHLFASELEKFRPFQGRIGAAIQASSSITHDLEALVRQVEKGKGVKERGKSQKERQRRVREWERNLQSIGESYEEVRAGSSKGLAFYDSLTGVLRDLSREISNWVKSRESERGRLVGDIETRQRIGSSPLDSQLAGMTINNNSPSLTSRPTSYAPRELPLPSASRHGDPTRTLPNSYPAPPPIGHYRAPPSVSRYPTPPVANQYNSPPPPLPSYPTSPPPSQYRASPQIVQHPAPAAAYATTPYNPYPPPPQPRYAPPTPSQPYPAYAPPPGYPTSAPAYPVNPSPQNPAARQYPHGYR